MADSLSARQLHSDGYLHWKPSRCLTQSNSEWCREKINTESFRNNAGVEHPPICYCRQCTRVPSGLNTDLRTECYFWNDIRFSSVSFFNLLQEGSIGISLSIPCVSSAHDICLDRHAWTIHHWISSANTIRGTRNFVPSLSIRINGPCPIRTHPMQCVFTWRSRPWISCVSTGSIVISHLPSRYIPRKSNWAVIDQSRSPPPPQQMKSVRTLVLSLRRSEQSRPWFALSWIRYPTSSTILISIYPYNQRSPIRTMQNRKYLHHRRRPVIEARSFTRTVNLNLQCLNLLIVRSKSTVAMITLSYSIVCWCRIHSLDTRLWTI